MRWYLAKPRTFANLTASEFGSLQKQTKRILFAQDIQKPVGA